MKIETIELSWLNTRGGWYYRINGRSWLECAPWAEFTPESRHLEKLQAAVVAIAYAEGIDIAEDDVSVDAAPCASNAWWCANV